MRRPDPSRPPSGRFVVRIAPTLHAALRDDARRRGVSLNDLCLERLETPLQAAVAPVVAPVVAHAAAVAGAELVGVVVYGSWARGEAGANSDADVLVVVEPSTPLNRALYRAWDASPVRLDGLVAEPHFCHLPGPGAVASGTWLEAAVDGIVLHDTEHRLGRRLVALRHDLLSGRVVRRVVHGQPYWSQVGERA